MADNIQSILGIFSVVMGIITSILTGTISYIVAKSNIEKDKKLSASEEKKVILDPQYSGVEAAEKLGTLSLKIAENLHEQLVECHREKDNIQKSLDILKIELSKKQSLMQKIIYKLNELINTYLLFEDNYDGFTIDGKTFVDYIKEIISEIKVENGKN